MQEIDFSKIRIHEGSQGNGFEELICQLANCLKPENDSVFIRKDGSGGDAGVECYWKLSDGSEHGWQAKFFLNPLGPTQWRQISSSVETALKKHPELTKYYICLPKNRTDRRLKNKKGKPVASELDRWNEHVQKWQQIALKKSISVEFEFWGAHEIMLMLHKDNDVFRSIANYWFGSTVRITDGSTISNYPRAIVDRTIYDETDRIRKSRFYTEFDSFSSSFTFAKRLSQGDLSGGTGEVRCKAMAWCVQFLVEKDLCKAEFYLKQAKEIGTCPEIEIAAAFVSSRRGDKANAMQILAGIDSPISRSATLMIVEYHEGPREAVDWLDTVGFDASTLDADGKRTLLACYFELADWEVSRNLVDGLANEDFHSSPALYHMAAVTHLLTAVPDELRPSILYRPPFEARYFPLVSDFEALEARRVARRFLVDGSKVAGKLNCPVAQKAFDEYALWLELRDPDASDAGQKRLESRLGDPVAALHLVRLGVQFSIALDLNSIDREIERQIALNGQMTADAAIARFALVFVQQTPRAAAEYIARHRLSLVEYIDDNSMRCLHIEYLAKAGQLEEAQKHLDLLVEEGISEFQIRQLQGIIAEVQGVDPLKRYEEQYNETRLTHDLQILVHELEKRCEWESLCDYGETYFQTTRALEDAERLAQALYNAKKNKQLLKLLEMNRNLLERSQNLQLLYCWALYMEGELLKANDEFAILGDDWDNPNYRDLRISLAISLGDRNILFAFIANECQKKEKRDGQDLIKAAELAVRLDSVSQARELIVAAVNKANDDPEIFGQASILAIRMGWEDEGVFHWFHRAAELSGDDGPFQTMTLRDIADRMPEWNRHQSEVSMRLTQGELPMFVAARSLNKSLSDLMLVPALVNSGERDPRRRIVVPAYSGKRQPTRIDTGGQVGIEATVLLTLSFLDLLDDALDAFETVHIPHTTIGWLFEEKQRAAFHQPSRIKDAHQVRHLLAMGALEELSPSTIPDGDLSEQIGEELAQYIAEAEKRSNEENSQHVVVQPAPVYRVASLMEEEADLTGYANVLCCCEPIVEKLRQSAQITASEAKRARAYLRRQEKRWPEQPQIADGAALYLDSLAVRHFLHLGILGKLKDAGFRAIISSRVVIETDQLISFSHVSGEVEKAIERIRSALNTRIESGKVKVSRRTNSASETEDQALFEHPTAGVLNLASQCDVIILDDRALHQHTNVIDQDVKTPIVSTLDLFDALVAGSVITERARLEYRTRLRHAGYFFVPVTEDELIHHLDASAVEKGKVIETAELKAIRENILQVRMTTWLQLPKEEPWLTGFLQTCRRELARLWSADGDLEKARARSEWILKLMDVRGWAHTVGIDGGKHIFQTKYAESILAMFSLAIELPPKVRDNYRSWTEERVLAPLKENNPDVFRYLLESYKGHISHVVEKCMKEMKNDDHGS